MHTACGQAMPVTKTKQKVLEMVCFSFIAVVTTAAIV